MTAKRTDELLEAVFNGVLPEIGSQLVVSAWLAERELDKAAFDEWHNRAVRELAGDVTLEFQQ